ncbi:MAG: cysteine-rich CWC family protein [Burkholderiales bacterium]
MKQLPSDTWLDPDPRVCPLCGADNCCALELERVTGLPQPPCWCTGVTIDAAVLDRIPRSLARISCVCPTCATARAPASPTTDAPKLRQPTV